MNANPVAAANPLLAAEGLPAFHAIRPEHVEPAVLHTLAANRAALEQLLDEAERLEPAFDAAVLPLERLADRLHRVWAPVRHLQAVVNTPELRAAYNACLPAISRYETEVGHNQRLYELYRRLSERTGLVAGEGGARLLEHALRDFRLAGVHLPPPEKARFKAIMEELTTAEAAFEQNVLDSAAAWSLHVADAGRVSGIPDTALAPAAARAAAAGQEGWLFHLDQPTYVAVVTHADDRELRQAAYRGWATRASDQADYSPGHDNSELIERILALRHEAAGLIGYPDYAAYSLATKMAKSVEEVRAFLLELVSHSREAARQELAELEAFAGQMLAPWDIAYYSEKLRHRRYAISDEELRPFFPLPAVLGGLFAVVERLYGVRIEHVPGLPAWEPHVQYYRLLDAGGAEIGSFYT
ncbi:MAG: oligopeptidase A, partial [Gammaproteobacteria bacterium]|nr:oligopeptidase A [Gammaproteobacteria bacterium]